VIVIDLPPSIHGAGTVFEGAALEEILENDWIKS